MLNEDHGESNLACMVTAGQKSDIAAWKLVLYQGFGHWWGKKFEILPIKAFATLKA